MAIELLCSRTEEWHQKNYQSSVTNSNTNKYLVIFFHYF